MSEPAGIETFIDVWRQAAWAELAVRRMSRQSTAPPLVRAMQVQALIRNSGYSDRESDVFLKYELR
jgi:hypothetical protein